MQCDTERMVLCTNVYQIGRLFILRMNQRPRLLFRDSELDAIFVPTRAARLSLDGIIQVGNPWINESRDLVWVLRRTVFHEA